VVSLTSPIPSLRVLPSVWKFIRYLRQFFKLRRRDPQDDLVSALIKAEEAGDKLNEDELLATVFLLLISGHETTVNLIGNGDELQITREPTNIFPLDKAFTFVWAHHWREWKHRLLSPPCYSARLSCAS